jgi:hypothetical protein
MDPTLCERAQYLAKEAMAIKNKRRRSGIEERGSTDEQSTAKRER